MIVGIASYARPRVFRLCLQSLARARVVKEIIAVVDAPDPSHREEYLEAIREVRNVGLEVIADVYSRRRGSTNARSKILDLAEQVLSDNDILVLYDDDYVCPGPHALILAKVWLKTWIKICGLHNTTHGN